MTDAIRELFELLTKKEKSGSDYTGKVTRVDGKTAYVQFDGSDISDTPVALSIGAKSGDSVRVRVADGRAWLIGNDTAPPNDSSEVASDLQITNNNLSVTNRRTENVASQVTNLEAAYASYKKVVTDELVAHQAVIDKLDATYANITLANIDTANINTASIKNLFTQVGLIRNAVVDGARITGYLDAVKINAASIDAGTLSVDRLVIRGSTSSLVYAINNISGALQSQNVNTINGEVLTDRTILADKIVAHTITANEITVADIVGTGGWINLALGTFNYGNKLVWDGSNLTVDGKITATSGSLSNLTIAGYLTTNASRTAYNQAAAGMTMTQSGIGGWGSATQYWNMTAGGVLSAAGVNVSGEITASKLTATTSGTIGCWTISSSELSNSVTSGSMTAKSSLSRSALTIRALSGSPYVQVGVMGADGGSFTSLYSDGIQHSGYSTAWIAHIKYDTTLASYVCENEYLFTFKDIGGNSNRCPISTNRTNGQRVNNFYTGASTTEGKYRLRCNAQIGGAGSAFSNFTVIDGLSDIRLKKNVRDTEVKSALSVIDSIRIRSFDWINSGAHQSIGFIADELEDIDARLSTGGGYTKDGGMDLKSVDFYYLQGYEVKAIQELHAYARTLEAEVEKLKRRIA